MARLITTGFEIPGYYEPFIGIENSGYGTVEFYSSDKRTGSYSIRFTGPGFGYPSPRRYANLTGTVTEVWVRLCFKLTGGVAANYQNVMWLSTDVTGNIVTVSAANGGNVRVYVNGTLRITGSATVSTGWNFIELHFLLSDTGVVELRQEGVLQGTWSGDTKPGADTFITTFKIGADLDSSQVLYDDIALNDSSGTSDNAWCGDGRIVAIRPNAAGDTTEWDVTGAANNWDAVDEVVPDDDTSYVYTSVNNEKDLYNLGTFSLPSGTEIKRVWVSAIAKKTSSEDDKISLGIKSGTTEDWASAQSLTTSYALVESSYWLLNPHTSAAWTQGDIDSLQAGIKASI